MKHRLSYLISIGLVTLATAGSAFAGPAAPAGVRCEQKPKPATAAKKQTPVTTATKKQTPVTTATKKQTPVTTATKKQTPVTTATKKQTPVTTATKKQTPVTTATKKQTPVATPKPKKKAAKQSCSHTKKAAPKQPTPTAPLQPAPTTLPIAPPATPPFSSPEAPPVTPPVAPPVTPPVAPPVTPPVTPPVEPPPTVIVLWADLFVTALSGSGFTVTNRGSADTGPFTVRVTLLVTVPISRTFAFDGLAAGASETRSFPCVSGLLVAVADADAQVAESDEDNTTQISASC